MIGGRRTLPMVRVIVAVRDKDPLVPVMTRVYVPAVVELTVRVVP